MNALRGKLIKQSVFAVLAVCFFGGLGFGILLEDFVGICKSTFQLFGGVAPGTAWEDLPEDWVCPWCGLDKDSFEEE